LLFHTDRSSLVYRVGFPILVQNLTQIAAQRAHLLDAKAHATGVLSIQKFTPDTEVQISGPNGQRETATSDSNGLLSGVSAQSVGGYEITASGDPIKIGVSLISSSETGLRVAETLTFPEVSISAATTALKTDQPLWHWFAMTGLVLLLVEWWYFQKRPFGAPG
jgi:hypothetical protein